MFCAFPGASQVALVVKNLISAEDVRAVSSIPVLGRAPGEGHSNPLQLFLPGELHGQRRLVGYSSQDHKESDTTEVTQHACTHMLLLRFYLTVCSITERGVLKPQNMCICLFLLFVSVNFYFTYFETLVQVQNTYSGTRIFLHHPFDLLDIFF